MNHTPPPAEQGLAREISLREATALNMIDMIGVGPFITIPLIIHAMGGPQAMLGWIVGALLAMCDGLVWAELGASFPRAGGSYQYLKESFGAEKLGRLMSFLFVWQLLFSAPLSIASGCLGIARYAAYLWEPLGRVLLERTFSWGLPLVGRFDFRVLVTTGTFVAMASCLLALGLLYRRIAVIGRLSRYLWVGVIATVLLVIAGGLSHFSAARAFSFPAHTFELSRGFWLGLGGAMLVTTYDYWGYYNVCFLGAEIRRPERNIPRAILYSIAIVAGLYIIMNISVLGVVPWQELEQAAATETHFYVASTVLQRAFGTRAGELGSLLVMWTAFASVFALMLGYSRVPYAAAIDGNYFASYARLHPRGRFPHVSLVTLGLTATVFCLFRLQDVIAALVVIRIMVQFLMQILGLLLLRALRPEEPRPFRMYFYPLPAVLAGVGFFYVLVMRPDFMKEIRYAVVIIVVGMLLYLARSWRHKQWPFVERPAHARGEGTVQ